MRHRRDISAGVIVFHREGDDCLFLLILSRLTRRPLWEFPKGGVSTGETLHQAALRELLEETGLGEPDIHIFPDHVWKEDYRFSAGQGESRVSVRKQVTYYLAEAVHTDVRLSSDEASEYAWLTLEEAQRRLRYPARRAMLAAAAQAANCTCTAAAQSLTSSRSREASRRSGSDRA
jgi:8-oxo-dGTP pyrophosphatase MutT (NUDIX family)